MAAPAGPASSAFCAGARKGGVCSRHSRAFHARPSRMSLDHRFAIAPMMEWTDRHCRAFHRVLTRRALLYTEMITTGAVLRGDRARLLAFSPAEHRIAVQLGGSDPRALAESARICAELG